MRITVIPGLNGDPTEHTLLAAGSGRLLHLGMYIRAVPDIASGNAAAAIETLQHATGDADVDAPLRPLLWVLEDRPTFTVWEHDRTALPFFDACAEALESAGYDAWSGIPDTRAILAARRAEDPPDDAAPILAAFLAAVTDIADAVETRRAPHAGTPVEEVQT